MSQGEWVLRNAAQAAAVSSEIVVPNRELLCDLRPGDRVKVCVVSVDDQMRHRSEWCWVEITKKLRIDIGSYDGKFVSGPVYARDLSIGSAISFTFEHVYELQH